MEQPKIVDEARQSYNKFEDFVTIKEGDSTLAVIGKILLRIIGILIMIALSPFLLVGLFIAFIAVF
jgi:ATP/ADP translocase